MKENKCIGHSNFNLNAYDLKRIRCLKCNQTFSIFSGNIFSRSKIVLTSWFYLIFRWINIKHDILSTDVARKLEVTLKTVWKMGYQIKTAIAKQKPKIIVKYIVQMDEMYLSHIGTKKEDRSLINKTLIIGIYKKRTNNLIVKSNKKCK